MLNFEVVRSEGVTRASNFKALDALTGFSVALNRNRLFGRCSYRFGGRA